MLDIKTREILRMIGHLLEHHPTTGVSARTGCGAHVGPVDSHACSWCLMGATNAVSEALRPFTYYGNTLELVKDYLRVKCAVEAWEGPGTSPKTRLTIARKLQQA